MPFTTAPPPQDLPIVCATVCVNYCNNSRNSLKLIAIDTTWSEVKMVILLKEASMKVCNCQPRQDGGYNVMCIRNVKTSRFRESLNQQLSKWLVKTWITTLALNFAPLLNCQYSKPILVVRFMQSCWYHLSMIMTLCIWPTLGASGQHFQCSKFIW